MNIKNTFLKLTSRTYPYGTESSVLQFLPKFLNRDAFGNLYHQIGETSVMFTSHLDTASSAVSQVKHVIDGDFIKTDGTSILGADDKAGVTIMLYMIKNKVPGLYYFFLGEESGCIGSRNLAGSHKGSGKLPNIKKVISFDRRDYTSVITHQMGSRCCSDTFADALTSELNSAGLKETSMFDWVLNYRKDSGGLYTDSAQFTSIYPECTNISVGYFSEHSTGERQNITHLEKLAKSCVFVDWENLPIERDPSKVEHSYYGYGDFYDGYDFTYNKPVPKTSVVNKNGQPYYKENSDNEENIIFWDKKHNYNSIIRIDKVTGKILKYDFSENRIQDEAGDIEKMLEELELIYDKIKWDGNTLRIMYDSENETITTRDELFPYLPELEFWNSDEEIMKKLNKIESNVQLEKETQGVI